MPGRHQSTSIGKALDLHAPRHGPGLPPTARTWKTWFSGDVVPKQNKIGVLDNIRNEIEDPAHPSRFFEEMVFGGLVSAMTKSARSRNSISHFKVNADLYRPLSPIHLLLDALEISALKTEFDEPASVALREIASLRLMALLHERWNARNGMIYSEFHSDLTIRWNAAANSEKDNIRSIFEDFHPNQIKQFLSPGASPDWSKVGIPVDTPPEHVHKILFLLVFDREFLVEDRLVAWSLDLAIATLALFSLAWANRYETFGRHISPEARFLDAMSFVLSDDMTQSDGEFRLLPVLREFGVSNGSKYIETFNLGRKSLIEILSPLNIFLEDLNRSIESAIKAQPLTYRNS